MSTSQIQRHYLHFVSVRYQGIEAMHRPRYSQIGRPRLWREPAKENLYFHKFPELPAELRLEIWNFSLPRPQNYYVPGSRYLDPEKVQEKDLVALRVNHESREIALSCYTHRDRLATELYRKNNSVVCAQYIDFQRDRVVYLNLEQFSLTKNIEHEGKFYSTTSTAFDLPEEITGIKFFTRDEQRKIANLALISGDCSFRNRDLMRWLHDWLPVFVGLKRFEFFVFSGEFDELDPDVYRTWNREVWSVQVKLSEWNELVRNFMENLREQKLANGVVWEVPYFKVDILRLKPVKGEVFKFSFDL